MSFSRRAASLAEIAERVMAGGKAGYEVKDFLHEFDVRRDFAMLAEAPSRLSGRVEDGEGLDAFLQALAAYLGTRLDRDPPEWTSPPVTLPRPWFASPGGAIRNYLLMSSPAPFRMRNLFIDEDSLSVV